MAKSDNCLFFPSILWNAYYVQGAKDTKIHKTQSLPSICSLERAERQMCTQQVPQSFIGATENTYKDTGSCQYTENEGLRIDMT